MGVRKHLQKVRLSGWDKIPFPQWPVDRSVDVLMERAIAARPEGQARIEHSVRLVLAGRRVGVRR